MTVESIAGILSSVTTETAKRTPGRPRSSEADRAILQTALRLLVEQGYDAMSIEGVASAAGVGKTTIYRRYPSKRELIVAAVSSLADTFSVPTESGDLRADLLVFLRRDARGVRGSRLLDARHAAGEGARRPRFA